MYRLGFRLMASCLKLQLPFDAHNKSVIEPEAKPTSLFFSWQEYFFGTESSRETALNTLLFNAVQRGTDAQI